MTTISEIKNEITRLNSAVEKTVSFEADMIKVAKLAANHIAGDQSGVYPEVAAFALLDTFKRADSENVSQDMMNIAKSDVNHTQGQLAYFAAKQNRDSRKCESSNDTGHALGMKVLTKKWVPQKAQKDVIGKALNGLMKDLKVNTGAIKRHLSNEKTVPDRIARPFTSAPIRVIKESKAPSSITRKTAFFAAWIAAFALLGQAVFGTPRNFFLAGK
jgi:hypothetical protein